MRGDRERQHAVPQEREPLVGLCAVVRPRRMRERLPGEIVRRLGASSYLLVLRKPFDAIEFQQMVNTLSRTWQTLRSYEAELDELTALLGRPRRPRR